MLCSRACEFGLVALVKLLVGDLNLFQLALETGKGAFITLIGELRLLPLLFEALDVRLYLREFSRRVFLPRAGRCRTSVARHSLPASGPRLQPSRRGVLGRMLS
jgi:hypothetical protein